MEQGGRRGEDVGEWDRNGEIVGVDNDVGGSGEIGWSVEKTCKPASGRQNNWGMWYPFFFYWGR